MSKKVIKNYLSCFVELIYPKLCSCCENKLYEFEELICSNCRMDLPYTNDKYSDRTKLYNRFNTIYPCSFVISLFFLIKKGKIENLIHQLKYKSQYEIGVLLGRILGSELLKNKEFNPSDYQWIIPVPLHKKRLYKRGYNQSEAIAKGLSKVINVPYDDTICMRVKNTKTQTQKNRINRILNTEYIFKLSKAEEINTNKSLIIIDDVITTGSTIDSLCDCIYKEKKIKSFGILSIARK